ncbi:MAG TPA: hypothetical protein VIS30_00255 [Candidatus Deferrimicrobiaceae bacterium]
MRRLAKALLVLLLPAVLAAGCASTTALKKADAAFGQAKAAGAEAKAPYEYYAAEAYLDLAHHEKAEGDGDMVVEFSQKSEKYSAEALQKAGGGMKQ